jgi:hypothetical protein
MYIPAQSKNLKDETFPQIRLGLQGEPGTGKTFSALTFPNPVVVDIDRGLTAFAGQEIISVPIWNPQWCAEFCATEKLQLRTHQAHPINRRDILIYWMERHAAKLQDTQTLLLDSWTGIQDYFDLQTRLEPVYTKQGEVDEYAFWDQKIDFSRKLCGILGTLQCHVVVTFHEARERDKKTGAILSKMQPLMQGKFVTRLQTYFTDFFRCLTFDRLDKDNKPIIETLPDGNKRKLVDYFWQTHSDSDGNLKCRMINAPDFIKFPTFEFFKKGYAK